MTTNPQELLPDLIDCLAGFRRFAGIKHDAIAQKIGHSAAHISKQETGVSPMTVEDAARYAAAIGAEVTVSIRFRGFSQRIPLFNFRQGATNEN